MQKVKNKMGELFKVSNIQFKDGKKYIDDIEVDYINEIRELMNFIESKPDLLNIALAQFEKKVYGRSRSGASIIGIPFDVAIENIINGKRNIKSMYYIDDSLENEGSEGRLISYCQENDNELHFQLWQILPFNLPTFYIHGIFDISNKYFTHFDGALIDHSEKIKEKMKWEPFIPEKNYPYEKLFRLDGIIMIEDAKIMMNLYLPNNELNKEYGLTPPIKMEYIE